MRKIVYLLLIAMAAVSCSSSKTAAERALEKSVDSVAHLAAMRSITNGYFVIRATSISDNYGNVMHGLSPDANFVLVQNEKGIVQWASMGADPGLNGLGGITLQGYIRDIDIQLPDDPQGEVTLKYMLVGSDVNATVFVVMHAGGDMATVTVIPTLDSGSVTIRGQVVPYRNDNLNIQP